MQQRIFPTILTAFIVLILMFFFLIFMSSCSKNIYAQKVYINDKPVKVENGVFQQKRNYFVVNGKRYYRHKVKATTNPEFTFTKQ